MNPKTPQNLGGLLNPEIGPSNVKGELTEIHNEFKRLKDVWLIKTDTPEWDSVMWRLEDLIDNLY